MDVAIHCENQKGDVVVESSYFGKEEYDIQDNFVTIRIIGDGGRFTLFMRPEQAIGIAAQIYDAVVAAMKGKPRTIEEPIVGEALGYGK